jgi:hypothetical protein
VGIFASLVKQREISVLTPGARAPGLTNDRLLGRKDCASAMGCYADGTYCSPARSFPLTAREETVPDDPKIEYLPVVEETASLAIRKVVTGRVRIATQTEEVDHILPAELSSVEVDVVRVPVDRKIEAVPDVVTEGELTIIPVVEERLVVTRELYLREEIHVRRVKQTETVEIPATTRRQTARIERLPADPAPFPNKDDLDDL